MTRKRSAGSPWRSVVWRGEPGTVGTFSILPVDPQYRERYLVTGTLRHVSDDPPTVDVLDVKVIDRETDASVTFPKAGTPTLDLPVLPLDVAKAVVARLGSEGPIVAAWARAKVAGRPSVQAERIEAIVAAAREIGPRATRLSAATRLGRVNEFAEMHGDYKRDVRAAGGWREIMRRAGF